MLSWTLNEIKTRHLKKPTSKQIGIRDFLLCA